MLPLLQSWIDWEAPISVEYGDEGIAGAMHVSGVLTDHSDDDALCIRGYEGDAARLVTMIPWDAVYHIRGPYSRADSEFLTAMLAEEKAKEEKQ